MALLEIVCPCGHRGYVGARSLPRMLRCMRCNRTRMIEKGSYTVRARTALYSDDDYDPEQVRRSRPQASPTDEETAQQ
jgi:hypothetical protein